MTDILILKFSPEAANFCCGWGKSPPCDRETDRVTVHLVITVRVLKVASVLLQVIQSNTLACLTIAN